ncbi:MAG: OmpA family protein [Muribaculaceae bacterium]|nr:OmpA family protein [Muribaculaceae bacterium]
MKTDKNDFKRIEGHAEPLELEEHYVEQPSAAAGMPEEAAGAGGAMRRAAGGGIGWASIAGLAAAFAVCAVYVLSDRANRHNDVMAVGETVVAEVAVPSAQTSSAAAVADGPDAVYLFPLNGASIAENDELNRVAAEARKTGADVNVVAYTDDSGRIEYNRQLSERRAKAVGDYLIAHGVDASRVHTSGGGPTHAYATAELDRRAEVTII